MDLDPSSYVAKMVEDALAAASVGDSSRDTHSQQMTKRCSQFPMTDLGNAERFAAYFGDEFLYVDQWGWIAWDGRRWNGREAGAILSRAVHSTVKNIADESLSLRNHAMKFEGGKLRDDLDPIFETTPSGKVIRHSDKLRAWGFVSQSNAHISCIARLAQAYMTASPDVFDCDPLAINVWNGTLRAEMVRGEAQVKLEPHRREDRITKISKVIYDREAISPNYDRFFNEVQPADDMWKYLHTWGGVSFSGLPVARISFWYGVGRNGKSTLMDTWAHVMGEYAQTIPIESFLDQGRTRRGGDASPDLASLPGVRCLRTSEPEKGAKLAESLVKLLTGFEPIRARHLNKDFFEFRPIFKLSMQGNHKPRIDGTDEGIWARFLLVPWTVIIPVEKRDPYLGDKLKAESSGVLNRLIDGLLMYLDGGLVPPGEVVGATQDYRDDSDPIGQFLRDCTISEPPEMRARVAGKVLYGLYFKWAGAMGERAWSAKAFSRGIVEHGIRRLKSSGIFYCNISLTKSDFDFEGQAYDSSD